jgi:hypothetical protein
MGLLLLSFEIALSHDIFSRGFGPDFLRPETSHDTMLVRAMIPATTPRAVNIVVERDSPAI